MKNAYRPNAPTLLADRIRFYCREQVRTNAADWGDEFRFMPPGNRYERWDTARTPFLRGIAEAISSDDPAHRSVLICKGAQLGCSDIVLNEVLRCIHQDPKRIIAYFPSKDFAEEWSRDRLEPALRQKPFSDNKAIKIVANTVRYPGGVLQFHGVGKSTGLRGITAQMVIADEVSSFQESISGEGDVLSLINARVKTFGDKAKIVMLSTPKLKSRGHGSWFTMCQSGDWRTYRAPCPHCNEAWTWKIDDVQKLGTEKTGYEYVIVCPSCDGAIEDGVMREDCIRKGFWEATKEPDDGVVSFQLSGLYVPSEWVSLKKLYEDYQKAVLSGSDLMPFVNNNLGEFFDEPVARTPLDSDAAMRMIIPEYKQGVVPDGVCVLTMNIDVQQSDGGWLSWEVRGWGKRFENWSIDRGRWDIHIDKTDEVTKLIRRMLVKEYPTADGKKMMRLRVVAIDSGWRSSAVYDVKDQFEQPFTGKGIIDIPRNCVIATRGERKDDYKLITGIPGVTRTKKGNFVRSWRVNGNYAKHELYTALAVPLTEEEDKIFARPHAPIDYDIEYYKELTAEDLVADRNAKDGTVKQIFKDTGKRNEALDHYCGTRFLIELLGGADWDEKDWERTRELELKEPGTSVRKRATAEDRAARRAEVAERKRRRMEERAALSED